MVLNATMWFRVIPSTEVKAPPTYMVLPSGETPPRRRLVSGSVPAACPANTCMSLKVVSRAPVDAVNAAK